MSQMLNHSFRLISVYQKKSDLRDTLIRLGHTVKYIAQKTRSDIMVPSWH